MKNKISMLLSYDRIGFSYILGFFWKRSGTSNKDPTNICPHIGTLPNTLCLFFKHLMKHKGSVVLYYIIDNGIFCIQKDQTSSPAYLVGFLVAPVLAISWTWRTLATWSCHAFSSAIARLSQPVAGLRLASWSLCGTNVLQQSLLHVVSTAGRIFFIFFCIWSGKMFLARCLFRHKAYTQAVKKMFRGSTLSAHTCMPYLAKQFFCSPKCP